MEEAYSRQKKMVRSCTASTCVSSIKRKNQNKKCGIDPTKVDLTSLGQEQQAKVLLFPPEVGVWKVSMHLLD